MLSKETILNLMTGLFIVVIIVWVVRVVLIEVAAVHKKVMDVLDDIAEDNYVG